MRRRPFPPVPVHTHHGSAACNLSPRFQLRCFLQRLGSVHSIELGLYSSSASRPVSRTQSRINFDRLPCFHDLGDIPPWPSWTCASFTTSTMSATSPSARSVNIFCSSRHAGAPSQCLTRVCSIKVPELARRSRFPAGLWLFFHGAHDVSQSLKIEVAHEVGKVEPQIASTSPHEDFKRLCLRLKPAEKQENKDNTPALASSR